MKRLLMVACTSLMFVAAGCDDDEKLPKTDAAAADAASDVAGGEVGGAVACTGTFMGLSRTQLGAAAMGGMCTRSTDLDLLCTGDIGTKIRDYGRACLLQGAPDPAACIRTEATAKHMNLSAGCIDCYIGSVTCTLSKCSTACTPDPSVPACMACQVAQGCISSFLTCAGIRLGGGATDAGTDARDGGSDTADGGTTSDAPADSGQSDAPGTDAGGTDTAGDA